MNLPELLETAGIADTAQKVLQNASWLVLTPLRILLIIVLAVIARWLTHRAIRRLTATTTSGETPTLLKPLKERTAVMFTDATRVLAERRKQRAETIGSVLRNVASMSIFAIAVLMILGELKISLAPLLASAGLAAVALGFGAQYLVRDVISGLFMIIEDQYGVGDFIDLGEASGDVEAVGLRVTTLRDLNGVVWYVRNGEVIRVGNHSQGWARVVVDVPIGLGTPVDEAVDVIRAAAERAAEDSGIAEKLIEAPDVWGVEQLTLEGPVVRTVVKTIPGAQWAVARHMRRVVLDALDTAGISDRLSANRIYVRHTGAAGTDPTAGA
ncbi:MAG: mechanosensitive ion channel family protein [Micromonosporaceae bacterium]